MNSASKVRIFPPNCLKKQNKMFTKDREICILFILAGKVIRIYKRFKLDNNRDISVLFYPLAEVSLFLFNGWWGQKASGRGINPLTFSQSGHSLTGDLRSMCNMWLSNMKTSFSSSRSRSDPCLSDNHVEASRGVSPFSVGAFIRKWMDDNMYKCILFFCCFFF